MRSSVGDRHRIILKRQAQYERIIENAPAHIQRGSLSLNHV